MNANTGAAVNSKPILHEVDLRKKKLEEEIQLLERKLKKQEMMENRGGLHGGLLMQNKSVHSRRVNKETGSPEGRDGESGSGRKRQSAISPRSQVSAKK